jgi:hypothetical protein
VAFHPHPVLFDLGPPESVQHPTAQRHDYLFAPRSTEFTFYSN